MKRKMLYFSLMLVLTLTSCGSQEVNFQNEEKITSEQESSENADVNSSEEVVNSYEDGEYQAELTMEGGTGKAYIQSPVSISIKDGNAEATLVWSSVNYDYMIVNEVKYMNETPGTESTFTIPVNDLNEPLDVIGDTVAMSTPHEIEYTLYFSDVTKK